MSAQSRPTFFCSRPNGDLTPLVAVDDLPTHVTVRGVPRSLSAEETHGMTSCGMALPRSEPYVVDGPAGTQVSLHAIAHKKLADELKTILTNVIYDVNVPSHHRQAVGAVLTAAMETPYFLNKGSNGNEAAIASGNAANTAMVPVNPANTALVPVQPPAQSHGNFSHGHSHGPTGHGKNNGYNKKMYCSYWIRHGECDYQQQGCLFKHEMPTDPAMLDKLGLRDIPRWYREKYGMTSILGHPTLGQLTNAPAANSHAVGQSGPTFKTIEYARNARTPANQNDQPGHPPRLNGRWRPSRASGHHGGRNRNNNWNRNAHHRHAGQNQNNNWSEMAPVPRVAHTGPIARVPIAPGPVSHPVGPAPVARGPVAPGVPFPGFVAPGPVHPGPVAPGPVAPVAPRPVAPVVQQSTTPDWTQLTPTQKNYLGPDSVISTSTDTSFSGAPPGTSTWEFLSAGMAPSHGSDVRPVHHLLDDNGMASIRTISHQLQNLTNENVPAPAPATAKNVKRGFNFGQDGNSVKDLGKATANQSLSALSHLVAESDPIGPNELLLNFGAIGGPVERPHSGQSAGGIPVSAGQETNLSSTGFGGKTAQKPAAM